MTWKGVFHWPWAAAAHESDKGDQTPTRRQIILVVDYITLLIAVTVLISTISHRLRSSAAARPDSAPTTSASR